MHGCGSIFTLLVNAEVDSMGGVIDGGVGIGIKTSPRQAAIERAQADLRQEYDVREERRRELEFLEKGGNPLDFKFGNAASISVQSTSLTDHQAEQFVTSEAKGSFARTASPHGDSAESSGRPGAPTVCEPNTADNFDGENEFVGNERKNKKSGRSHNFQSEYSSQIEGTQSAKDSEDSALVRPYARRNRSRPNRESARSSSTDVVQSPSLHGSSAVGRVGSRDAKGLSSENIQKDYSASACNQKSKVENGDLVAQNEMSTTQSKMNVDAVKSVEPGAYQPKSAVLEDRLDATDSSVISVGKNNQLSNANIPKEPVETTTENVVGKVDASSADPEGLPSTATSNTEKETAFAVANGFADSKQDGFKFQNAGEASKTKGLDSESSCTQNSLRLDANKDIENGTSNGDEDGNENVMKETLEIEVANRTKADEMNNKTSGTKAFDIGNVADDDPNSLLENRSDNISAVKAEQDAQQFSQVQDGVKCSNVGVKNNLVGVDAEKNMGKTDDLSVDFNKKNASLGGAQGTMDLSTEKLLQPNSLLKNSSNVSHQQPSATRMEDKAREDSILEEARIIEAKRRRIAELSGKTVLIESRQKSSWDFVLEEMAWLANDFAQERLWKMTAAAQISHRIAFTSGLCFDKKNQQRQMKKVAYNLAKAVMQFWQSTELLLDDYDQEFMKCVSDGKHSVSSKEPSKGLRKENNGKSLERSIQGYAIRFLKCSKTQVSSFQAEAPATPEREADADMVDISWDDNLTEGSLFYRVPSGAMAAYRMSIESHLLQCEKTDINSQEEVDTSGYDAAAEEGETSTYYTHGIFTANKSSKHDQKKRKFPIKSHSAKHYEVGASLPYAYSAVESPQIVGIRPASNFSVGPALPKRVRTASRQKLVNPFGGVTGVLQASTKTDGSSGDTNSFQDDQIALNDGSQVQKGMEAESVANFEKLLPYDCTEASGRPKKKKPKHMVSAFEHGWHLDSTNHIEQRDTSKKRPDHQFDPNGTSGVFGQPTAKKLKVLKQFQENTYENVSPRSGSIPSPAASQMSNIPNTNKVIRFISGRERGRKHKSQKMSIAQPGSGSTWSTFEDQALVVLVHDLGPNWELVSDAMNSTLKFKCIYHNPKECKDRHKMLMDKGDGDDSAEDSGSSQPYPSTLPGIPKGNARQLFQHLQGPVEEDTLKSHFEKIIMIGKKQHYKRIQNDTLDSKQVAAVHNSHATALNSVWPNNLNGVVLTPLDLCDATVSSPDVISPVYQGSHTSGLVLPSQGAAASGVNSPISSTGMFVGNNLPSSSAPLNAPIRYNVQRTSADEQQQLQNGGQMLSRRNVMQQNFSAPGALSGPDRVRMQSGGNGMGTMPGMNRSMPALRPNLQSMVSSPALNSGNVLSSGMVGTPNHLRMPASGPSQGNPMMRSREALHMMQTYPGHPQQQHQMSPQQSHVLSSSHHHHHLQGTNHGNPSQQQAYAMRIAKERQMQRLSQHQQQFATSNPLVPHAQPQSQHPISSPVQNNNLIQPQTSSQSLSMPQQLSSSTTPAISLQQQQKHNLTHHTLGRNSQTGSAGLASQTGKQRQRQPPPQQQQFQQTSRQHPQQRQHLQPTQQAKLMKGMGRGNMMVQQNLPTEHSNVNGFSTPPANQNVEKGEQIMHLMQSQGLGAGTGVSPVQVSKPLVSPHSSQPQQKLYPGMVSPSSKQMQQMSSHSDSSTLSHPGSAGHGLGGTNQAVSAASRVSNLQHPQPQLSQQAQLQPKAVSRVQPNIPRMHIQNHQANSDLQSKTQSDNSIQQPGGMVSLVGTNTIMPPACTAPANMQPVVSSAVSLASQRRPSENLYDSGLANPATQVGTSGSPSVSNSLGSETAVPVSQGHGQGQLSGGVPLNGNNTGTEWQSQSREQAQAQTQLQQSTTPPPSQPVMQSQEQQLQQEQQPPGQPQSQPSNLYIRPTNSKLG